MRWLVVWRGWHSRHNRTADLWLELAGQNRTAGLWLTRDCRADAKAAKPWWQEADKPKLTYDFEDVGIPEVPQQLTCDWKGSAYQSLLNSWLVLGLTGVTEQLRDVGKRRLVCGRGNMTLTSGWKFSYCNLSVAGESWPKAGTACQQGQLTSCFLVLRSCMATQRLLNSWIKEAYVDVIEQLICSCLQRLQMRWFVVGRGWQSKDYRTADLWLAVAGIV